MNYGSRYYAYNMDQDSKTELFCISSDNKYEKILNYMNSWYTGWGNAGSYQIYNRDITNSDRFFFGIFTSDITSPQVLWIKESWPTCPKTHAYLHEMPAGMIKSTNNSNIENDISEKISFLFHLVKYV